MILDVKEYMKLLIGAEQQVADVFEDMAQDFQELKKIQNYSNTKEDLQLYYDTDFKYLKKLIDGFQKLSVPTKELHEFCTNELFDIAELLKVDFSEIKDSESARIVLEKNDFLSSATKDSIFSVLEINDKLRISFHQIKAILANSMSITFLEYKLEKQLKLEKPTFTTSEILKMIKTSEIELKRFERSWYELVNLNRHNYEFQFEQHSSKELKEYLELQKEKLANYYFYGRYREILLVNDGLDDFAFKSDIFKIKEILDVILNNAAEELSVKSNIEESENVQITEKKINFSITLSKENNTFLIRIKDNGRGIPDTTLIFKPYYTTKKAEGGSGIGLSAALKITKALGGSVIVNTMITKGSTFYIEMPIEKN